MALQIMMDDQAKEFLSTKEALTISRVRVDGCCVPMTEVLTTFSTPPYEQDYHHLTNQDIPIYIEKNLDFKEDKVIIKVTKFKPFTSIRVEGLKRF